MYAALCHTFYPEVKHSQHYLNYDKIKYIKQYKLFS